jgi:tetratricopeptide (TPR) repeat protein
MIAEYRIFQRQAFDAKQMRRAFQNWQDGKAFYEECIARNSNPYIKQQAALYLDDFGRHEEAYIFIERAVRDARNRIWTINNTYAIIVFKTNIHREGPDVRPSLDESMEILNECYRKDARKPYHLVIFGRQAVQYIRRYKDERAQEYVRIAAERVDEMLNKSDSSWFRKDLGDLQRDLYDVSR